MMQTLDIMRLKEDLAFDTELEGVSLHFQSTWGLFSPKSIDDGTRLLAHYLEIQPGYDALDLGCGYGPLGIYMAKKSQTGRIVMVDKDFIAIEYAQRNAQVNQVSQCEILLSNGFSHVPKCLFDVVVSNVPAKTGKELYYILLLDAFQHLKPGGRFYVVTITGLRRFFEKGFKAVFGHYKKVKQGKTYTVAYGEKR